MVVEICSENCVVSSMSPRISFSHDFSQSDFIPVEKHPLRSNSSGLNSSTDFDFCVHESLELESSSADELFSDGVILPTQIKKKNIKNALLKQKSQQLAAAPPPPQPQLPPTKAICYNASSTTRKSSKKESHKDSNKDLSDEVDEKQSSKSFWRFKRSSSCGSGYGSSLCPLPLLSRSNSTGSSPSVKRIPLSKEGHHVKQSSQKRSSSISRSSHSLASHNHQKPPLKRSHGSYANGVRVSPILNVPSANLFGLGSIFSNNRDKSKKK